MTSDVHVLRQRVKKLLLFFVIALLFSGLTAFPLKAELNILERLIGEGSSFESVWPQMAKWISVVHTGLIEVSQKYPFLSYGTDWLAFAHIIIAIAFIGPILDPVRNMWVVDFGLIACVLVIPFALIFGSLRGIPFFWRLIDCSFGLVGIIPLWLARRYIQCLIQVRKPEEGTTTSK